MNRPKTAVLLAAGRGKRLRPHTDTTPKPLLPVQGRPTLDFVLEAAVNAGIQKVCFVVGYLGEQIKTFIGDGAQWGIEPYFCEQRELLGTAHALQIAVNAHPHLFVDSKSFILSATDYLLPIDFLSALVDHQQQTKADIVVSLKKMRPEQLIGRSSIRYHGEFVIEEIIEKPAAGNMPSQYGANLSFILPIGLKQYLSNMKISPRGEYEIQTLINEMIVEGATAKGMVQTILEEWTPKFA